MDSDLTPDKQTIAESTKNDYPPQPLPVQPDNRIMTQAEIDRLILSLRGAA